MTSASNSPALPTDQAVLEYLQRKGLGTAALELSNLLKKEKPKDTRAELEEEDYIFRNQRTLLAKVSVTVRARTYFVILFQYYKCIG
jgi:hypothetical protein